MSLTYVLLRVKIVSEKENKMPMTPREMIKLLRKNGFEEVSRNGSHVKMKNYCTGRQ